uniref:Uncharacterized protein n=1 Tax=Arundo donax TaxID=35708 RepID=A0A0A8Y9R8_ARUDO
MVEKYYPADFSQQERIGLEHQLDHFLLMPPKVKM